MDGTLFRYLGGAQHVVHLTRDLGNLLLPAAGPQDDGEARQVQAHAVEERRHGDGALVVDRD